MDSYKQRILTLEKRVEELESSLNKSHNLKDEVQHVSIDKEMGVIPLNEFDTYRFVRVRDWLMPEFTKTNGTWKHGMVTNTNLYFLTNPTQEIKELIEMTLGYKINFSRQLICFKFLGAKEDFEDEVTNKKFLELYLFWYQGGPCYGKINIIQPLYSEFDKKAFEIIDLPHTKPTKDTPYDLILYDFISGNNFSATMTVDFKNTYLLLPHVCFFLTPIPSSSIQVRLIEVSTTQAVFEFKYGKELVPTTTQFHWLANGSVQKIELGPPY
jgi:hypothetical protein